MFWSVAAFLVVAVIAFLAFVPGMIYRANRRPPCD